MEWTDDKVLELIELYRARPNLWNCKLAEYKDKNKRHDALNELATHFKVEKSESRPHRTYSHKLDQVYTIYVLNCFG